MADKTINGSVAINGTLSATEITGYVASGDDISELNNDAGYITISDVPVSSTTTPLMDGAANIGTDTKWAKGDHRHPTDTTRAPLDSPALTGTPTAPTAATGSNTTQIATTEFVQSAIVAAGGGPSPSIANPLMDGVASPGSAAPYSREDHVHPSDTSKAPLASPALTGVPTAPTASSGTNTTQIATTEFVQSAVGSITVPVTSVNSKTGNVVLTSTDVGALSDNTYIPSKTSDLNNDSGYITINDVPQEVFVITVSGSPLTADKTYAQIQAAIAAGKNIIVKSGEFTYQLEYYVAASGAVFTSAGYYGSKPKQFILTVDPQDTWTSSSAEATCANIGALPTSGGTMTGQLVTSFGAVAMGTKDGGSCTLPDLAAALRYSSGVAGSFYLTTAYEINQWAVNIPVGWYNYLWIPHRTGGNNGQASGDNCDYGTLFLSGMTGDLGAYSVRYTNGAISQVMRLDNVNAGSWQQPIYIYRGVSYGIDWYIGNASIGGVDANNVTNNFCGYYNSNGPSTSIGASTIDGALWTQAYNASWMGQIAQDYRNGNLFVRGKNNGTWQPWQKISSNGTVSVSLPVANWNTSSKTITVAASGVTASNTVMVSPAPASISVYSAAGVYCSAQGSNSLTFTCSSIPTAALTVNVVYFS